MQVFLNLVALAPLTPDHGGHGAMHGDSLVHYLLDPAHLPLMLLAAAAGLIGLRSWLRRRSR